MRLLAICFAALLYVNTGNCQDSNEELTSLFAFHVKSIDDFFDRFNFRKNTGFQNYFKNKYPDYVLTRQTLILNLFDHQKIDLIGPPQVNNFINEVTDSLSPQKLKYSDSAWFAVLDCRVIYRGKPRNMTMILKVEQSKQNTFRWSVVSAKAEFLKYKKTKSDSIIMAQEQELDLYWLNRDRRFSLSPVSHGIDFMNLDNFFIHRKNVNDYVYSGQRTFELNKLISLIQKSQIKLVAVKDITYYLFQLNGWIIVVDYFNRHEKNSGWLIKQLIRATSEEKNFFLFENLNVRIG